MKKKAVAYKGGKCERCGYDKCVAAMDFHHVNPDDKDFKISDGIWSWDRLKPELDKCMMLCANCHREEHENLKAAKLAEDEEEWQRRSRKFPPVLPRDCKKCGKSFKPFYQAAEFCSSECSHKASERCEWPSNEELSVLVWKMPVTSLAAQLGVSSSVVKKRCKLRNIATPPRGYWQILSKNVSQV